MAEMVPRGKGIVTLYKSFDECVKEILELQKEAKTIPPRLPTSERGVQIDIYSKNFSEVLAELRRLTLIKEMIKRRGTLKIR
jgi:hypothetical protein